MDRTPPDIPELDSLIERGHAVFEETQSFVRVKEFLLSEGLDEDAAKYVVRLVDEFVTEEHRITEEKRHARWKLRIGAALTTLGAVNLFLTSVYESKQSLLRYSIYLLLGVGVWVLWRAWSELKRLERGELEIDDSKFRLDKRFVPRRRRRR